MYTFPTPLTKYTIYSYLRSPIIVLVIGTPPTILHAHEALLSRSPFFALACENFTPDASTRRIELPSDDLAAAAAVLEYIYKGDYYPSLTGPTAMEDDPSIPFPDHAGTALLRHANIYTLAQRFGLPALAQLAHKKIHLTQSTAKGEIAYARFVYQHTGGEDVAIRKPVANFWSQRSHVLRHEAEAEFKGMCLEFPQFGFDVLSLVLDGQEKRSARAEAQSSGAAGGQSGRKRQRVSGV